MLNCICLILCSRCRKSELARNSLSVCQFPASWYGAIDLNRCPRFATYYRIVLNNLSLLILVDDLKRLIISSINNRNRRIDSINTDIINCYNFAILKTLTRTDWVISSLRCWRIFFKTSLSWICVLPASIRQMIIKEVPSNAPLKWYALRFSFVRSIGQLKNDLACYRFLIICLWLRLMFDANLDGGTRFDILKCFTFVIRIIKSHSRWQ